MALQGDEKKKLTELGISVLGSPVEWRYMALRKKKHRTVDFFSRFARRVALRGGGSARLPPSCATGREERAGFGAARSGFPTPALLLHLLLHLLHLLFLLLLLLLARLLRRLAIPLPSSSSSSAAAKALRQIDRPRGLLRVAGPQQRQRGVGGRAPLAAPPRRPSSGERAEAAARRRPGANEIARDGNLKLLM